MNNQTSMTCLFLEDICNLIKALQAILDKGKSIGTSCVRHAMFKKWYQMGLMGNFDFMVVNGRQAWNMSMKKRESVDR